MMGIISQFNDALHNWFLNQGIDVDFVEGEDFCFYTEHNTVQYGLLDDPDTDNHFEQFMYEYGIKYSCHCFILSLLHEVAHQQTLFTYFTEEERKTDKVAKNNYTGTRSIETNYWYWELPTEFAANMCAINWVNTHIDELRDLHNLCSEWLDKIYDDANIFQQIMDWQDEIMETKEYKPLIIYEEE